MEAKGVTVTVLLEVVFTREEVDALWKGAESHYDARCRSTIEQPQVIGGFIFKRWREEGLLVGLRAALELPGATSHEFSFGELDTLAKVAESPAVPREIAAGIFGLMRRFNAEYDRVNHA